MKKILSFSTILTIVCMSISSVDCESRTLISTIVNETITVNAGGYNFYRIFVEPYMKDAKLTGSFIASGGSGNDIKVYIMDETNYINWFNGHQANCYYNSGQITTGSFNIYIPTEGTYYLVYDNTFSTFSNKRVSTYVNLEYKLSDRTEEKPAVIGTYLFLLLIFIQIVFSGLVAELWRHRGRNMLVGFLISLFFTPIIGLILALVLKPNYKKIEAKQLESGEMKKCPYCAEIIKKEAKVCRYCGREL